MTFKVKHGTGKASCQVCKKPIEKREYAVVFIGNRTGGQAHLVCLNQLAIQNTGE